MTILDCSVTGCMYNEANCCHKGNIKVEGEDAKESEDTCCGSFAERGDRCGWYFGDSDKECWFKPKKVMGDVTAVHIGSGKIIVTRMDGSKWGTGIGFGNERSESGKKVGTRFVMISK